MAHPVVHFEIAGKDGTKLQEFYGKLFDWKISVEAAMGNYGLVEGSEGGIGGGIFQGQEGIAPFVTVYVSVDDLQAYLDKAVRLGGKTVLPPTPIPSVGAFAMFHDPEGNLVGLFKG